MAWIDKAPRTSQAQQKQINAAFTKQLQSEQAAMAAAALAYEKQRQSGQPRQQSVVYRRWENRGTVNWR